MISWIIIPISAWAYRFRGGGGGFKDIEPSLLHSLRKPIYCIVTGAVFGLLAWDIWAGVIVGVGSLLPPLTSPRPLFWGWQNKYDAAEVASARKWYNFWMYDFAEKVTNFFMK